MIIVRWVKCFARIRLLNGLKTKRDGIGFPILE